MESLKGLNGLKTENMLKSLCSKRNFTEISMKSFWKVQLQKSEKKKDL